MVSNSCMENFLILLRSPEGRTMYEVVIWATISKVGVGDTSWPEGKFLLLVAAVENGN